MIRRFCDSCGAAMTGRHSLDNIEGEVRTPAQRAKVKFAITVRQDGEDMCRVCLVDAVSRWVEAERRDIGGEK